MPKKKEQPKVYKYPNYRFEKVMDYYNRQKTPPTDNEVIQKELKKRILRVQKELEQLYKKKISILQKNLLIENKLAELSILKSKLNTI
jgi:hypothetical protein